MLYLFAFAPASPVIAVAFLLAYLVMAGLGGTAHWASVHSARRLTHRRGRREEKAFSGCYAVSNQYRHVRYAQTLQHGGLQRLPVGLRGNAPEQPTRSRRGASAEPSFFHRSGRATSRRASEHADIQRTTAPGQTRQRLCRRGPPRDVRGRPRTYVVRLCDK